MVLEVAGVSAAGKAREAVHAEFQRAGFFLTHVLECAFETLPQGGAFEAISRSGAALSSLLAQHLPAAGVRIRRSLKPKRVALISRALEPIVEKIAALQLGCPLVLEEGKPFALDGPEAGRAAARLREALAIRMD
jgi:hypothetical protein